MEKRVLFFIGLLLVGCVPNAAEPAVAPLIDQQPDLMIENSSTEQLTTEQKNTTTEDTPSMNPVDIDNSPKWWKPQPETSWQWQLMGTLNTGYAVEMYDVDLFDTSKEAIAGLQAKGIRVICYFSAGSYEDWRSDEGDFPSEVLGTPLEGWDDEKWLDVSKIDLLAPIMRKRLDLAVEKGCDGVEPDNVDGYLNNNGFSLTAQDQLAYNKWLANEAHKRALSIGLKNDVDQIVDLVDDFDFAVNEQCFEYDECELLLPFIEQNKAVFGVEYELETDEFCELAKNMRFSWLKMDYDLDGGRIGCE